MCEGTSSHRVLCSLGIPIARCGSASGEGGVGSAGKHGQARAALLRMHVVPFPGPVECEALQMLRGLWAACRGPSCAVTGAGRGWVGSSV